MRNHNPKISAISHVSYHVRDLNKSTTFYTLILGFKLVERPNFDFNGAWLRSENEAVEIHLIDGNIADVSTTSNGTRKNHLALRTDDILFWAEFLSSKGIEFIGPKPRPDGKLQLFLQDPDGNWLELTNG